MRVFWVILAVLGFAHVAQAENALKEVYFSEQQEGEMVTLEFAQPANCRVFTLSDPDRLVIDMPPSGWAAGPDVMEKYPGSLISNVRFGKFSADKSRLVLDLKTSVAVIETFPQNKGGQNRFTVEIAPQSTAATETSGVPRARPLATSKKPIIVIDPGHGGIDPGTEGVDGTKEKNVTLAFARALSRELLKTGRYQVALTREDDQIIRLRDRFRIAQKAGADLFISLHADSAPTRAARGLSVYTVSEKASDEESAALAEQENKVDILTGMDLSGESEDVANILIDLARRESRNKSTQLARALVGELKPYVRLLPNPHRFAGFAVLKAPDIPSVLVEIGFLSHPEEERTINSRSYQRDFLKGMVAGIDKYFKQNKK